MNRRRDRIITAGWLIMALVCVIRGYDPAFVMGALILANLYARTERT